MFPFFKKARRRKLLDQPITDTERTNALRSIWQFPLLNEQWQSELIRWCRIFIKEKNFEGCNGLQITDEIQWTIAISAAICVPPNSNWYFEKTETILVYPTAYVAQVRPSVFSQSSDVVGEFARAGETIYRGPVILNWADLQAARVNSNGGNQIAIHEFSHQIDMINGPHADGIPPLASDVESQPWINAMKIELQHARKMREDGYRIYINDYGLTSAQEFFAVASEYFFQTPHALAEYHPGVFARLKDFYRVDLRQFVDV
jgi:Mlc titration factor MtfA (ptsG expression regulator)